MELYSFLRNKVPRGAGGFFIAKFSRWCTTLFPPLVTQAIANEDTSLTARDNMSAILEAVSERNIASLHANTVSW